MRQRITALLVGIGIGLLATIPLRAQTVVTPKTVRYGMLAPKLADSLATFWSDSAGEVERALCVVRYEVFTNPQPDIWAGKVRPSDDSLWVVTAVEDPIAVEYATPVSLSYRCRPGQPSIHSHPPLLCTGAACATPGLVHMCGPSRQDYDTLIVFGLPFGAVRCGDKHYVFYFAQGIERVKAKLKPRPKS